MADDNVSVQFGAQLEGLLSGIKQATDSIQGLAAPIQAIQSSFKELGEVIIAAFAVEKIDSFFEGVAQRATDIERLGVEFGMAAEQVQTWQYAMKASGGSADKLQSLLSRLSVNMQKAIAAAGPQRTAFEALGVSTQFLKDHSNDLDAVMRKLADGFQAAGGGSGRAADLIATMGRGAMAVAPAFAEGSAGIDKFNAKVKETGATLTVEQQTTFSDLHASLTEMGSAFQGLGNTIAEAFGPAFSATVRGIAEFTEALNGGADKVSVFRMALAALATVLDIIILTVEQLKVLLATAWDAAAIAVDYLAAHFSALAVVIDDVAHGHLKQAQQDYNTILAQMDSATKSRVADIKKEWNDLADTADKMRDALQSVWSGGTPANKPTGGGGSGGGGAKPAGMETQLQQWKDQLTQQLIDEENFFADSRKEELAFWQDKLQLTKEGSKERLAVEEQVYSLEKQLAQEDLQDQLATIKQKQEAAKSDFNTVMALEKQKLDLLKDDYGEDSKNYQAALREKEAMDREHAAQSNKIYEQLFNSIDKTFDQMLTGILQGTQTWQAALQRMFSNLAVSFTEAVATMTLKWAAFEALGGSGGGGLSTALGKSVPTGMGGSDSTSTLALAINALFGATTAQTAAQTAGTAATALSTTATTANTTTQVAQVGQNSVETVSNTGAIIANTAAQGSSGGGGLFSLLAMIPSFDVGSWSIPSDTLAMVHAGEMIIPAAQSAAIRSGAASLGGGAGGGDNYTVTINAVDSQSVANLLKSNSGVITQIMSQQTRNANGMLRSAMKAS